MFTKVSLAMVVGVALVVQAACASAESSAPATTPPEWCTTCVHTILSAGGSLYVGTITEVKPQGGRRYTEWGEPRLDVYGEVTLRVEDTLWGPPVDEFRDRYLFTQDAPADPPALDIGGYVWDRYPPRPGMRLALLVYGKKDREKNASEVKEEGPVVHVWPAPKDDPFLRDFAEACKLLRAKELGELKALIKRLGRSKYETIRYFARDIVFKRADDEEQSERVLEYLRVSDPVLTDDADRCDATERLFDWLNRGHSLVEGPAGQGEDVEPRYKWDNGGHWKDLPEDLRAAVEDWILGELAARTERGRRTSAALRGLHYASTHVGVAQTVALFKRAGRAGLLERVKAVDTPDERDKKIAQELQDMLQQE